MKGSKIRSSDDEEEGGGGGAETVCFGGGVMLCILVVFAILSSVIVMSITALASRSSFQSTVHMISADQDLPSKTKQFSAPLILLLNSSLTSSNAPVTAVKDKILEYGLSRARAAIKLKKSPPQNISDVDVYRNAAAFHRSYKEMEKRFKVYIYEEGESPLVHSGPCKNIYASEGRFMEEMEHGDNGFRTRDPHLAHAFYMPFGVTYIVKYLYDPADNYHITPLKHFVSDYIRLISTKYPFWNRTMGADHFMLACHDWGPLVSSANPFLFNTSIRALCNSNSSEGFNPRKDVSVPEVHTVEADLPQKLQHPPPPNNPRSILGFFAGGNHGYIRSNILQHWKGRDPELQVHEYLPEGVDYYTLMLQSKFCLCPSGYEVASPRIVEAIYTECVPVILSDHFVLPLSDVLNWEAFSVKVDISEIPRLKEVLMAIPNNKYQRLKEGLGAVRKHFLFNQPAQRFDVFHMTLHSIWLRRINLSFE